MFGELYATSKLIEKLILYNYYQPIPIIVIYVSNVVSSNIVTHRLIV